MKNPIRAWVAKIVREEVQAMRRESNLKAIQDEINEINRATTQRLTAEAFYKRRPEDKFTIGDLS